MKRNTEAEGKRAESPTETDRSTAGHLSSHRIPETAVSGDSKDTDDAILAQRLLSCSIEQIQDELAALSKDRLARLLQISKHPLLQVASQRNRYEMSTNKCMRDFRPPWPVRGPNYYTILGLPLSATNEMISRSFRLLVQMYHPDLLGQQPSDSVQKSSQYLDSIVMAKRVLCDAKARLDYEQRMGLRIFRIRLFDAYWFPDRPWYDD
jgi:hypothetical protein